MFLCFLKKKIYQFSQKYQAAQLFEQLWTGAYTSLTSCLTAMGPLFWDHNNPTTKLYSKAMRAEVDLWFKITSFTNITLGCLSVYTCNVCTSVCFWKAQLRQCAFYSWAPSGRRFKWHNSHYLTKNTHTHTRTMHPGSFCSSLLQLLSPFVRQQWGDRGNPEARGECQHKRSRETFL